MVTVRPNFQDSVHVGYVAGLRKFAEYFTSVLCFTTPGDGPRSPPQLVRTHEDGTGSSEPLGMDPARPRLRPRGAPSPLAPRGGPVGAEGILRLGDEFGWFWAVPGPVGHLSFSDILDTSLKVSWQEPLEKNGILTGKGAAAGTGGVISPFATPRHLPLFLSHSRSAALSRVPLSPRSVTHVSSSSPAASPLCPVLSPPHRFSHPPCPHAGGGQRGGDTAGVTLGG